MPNRMMSFAVLLFSFAVVLLGFQPKAGTPTASYNREFHVPVITPPVQTYWVVGSLVIAASLLFIIVACRQDWSKSVKKFMTQRAYIYLPVSLVFWLLYVVTWLKGVAAILSISPPHWVVYWGRMSIVDTKAFMLPVTRHSIFGHTPPATGSPV